MSLTRRSFIKKSSYSAAAVTILGAGVGLANTTTSGFYIVLVSVYTDPDALDDFNNHLGDHHKIVKVTYNNGHGTAIARVKITLHWAGADPDSDEVIDIACPESGNQRSVTQKVVLDPGYHSLSKSHQAIE